MALWLQAAPEKSLKMGGASRGFGGLAGGFEVVFWLPGQLFSVSFTPILCAPRYTGPWSSSFCANTYWEWRRRL